MSTTLINPAKPAARPKLPPLPPPPPVYHRLRRNIHLLCVAIFCVLPFFNLMRFDIPKQRFYIFGHELWINEFAIIFFSLMFLMFVIVAMSLLYGRVYCGYLCPQMIFSDASVNLEAYLKRIITKRFIQWKPKHRQWLERSFFLGVVGVASVFLAFVFVSYFVEPRDLLNRLLHLDITTAAGISGATVTLLTFLDFTLLRQRFCTTVCPYGYLQGMLVDKNSLLIHYQDPQRDCIECKKCIRVCHMGIDIRTSPHQMECIHCGECVDSCHEIMAKVGKPGLIHYAWGDGGAKTGDRAEPWYRRLGLRDAKRAVVIVLILFYFTGLMTFLSLRHHVMVQIQPQRAEKLYVVGADGVVANQFRAKLVNRGSQAATLQIGAEGLPGARVEPAETVLQPGEERTLLFDVLATPWPGQSDVNHFRLTAKSQPENTQTDFDMTFLMPQPKK
jgi:polyferredoxin